MGSSTARFSAADKLEYGYLEETMGFLCGRMKDAFPTILNISNSLELCGEHRPGGEH